MIFCLDDGKYESKGEGYQKNYRAFNLDVSEKRYEEILKEVKEILKDFKLELNKNSWVDEWRKVSKEQWLKLSQIPEFDKEVVEGIIGFELDLNKVEEMTVEQVCKELGRDIKIVK